MTRSSHPPRPCETGGKTHGEICYWALGACFNCGGMGHLTKDCTSARRFGPPPTTTERSIQSSVTRGSQPVSRGRGRGQGSTSSSQGTVNQSEQGSAPSRVYTMRQWEEAETFDIVAGTFSISDQDVFILFDLGSTLSYVNASIVSSLAVPCVKMGFEVLVTSPLGQEVRVNRM